MQGVGGDEDESDEDADVIIVDPADIETFCVGCGAKMEVG
jgi:hypothetical protein